jgi:hypothetical protein
VTVIATPSLSGLLFGMVGFGIDFQELVGASIVTRLDASLAVPSASDVDLEVSDGTTAVGCTITAGQTFGFADLSQTYASGARLSYTVAAAGADASGLSGHLHIAGDAVIPSAGPGLVTVDEFVAARNLSALSSADSDFIQLQIDASSQRIRDYCGRHFNRSYYSVDHDIPRVIFSIDSPLHSVAVANLDGTDVLGELVTDFNSGRIARDRDTGGPYWYGYNLHLEYEAGPDVIPADIREALYRALLVQLGNWQTTGNAISDQGTLKRVSYTGAGSVEYVGSASAGAWDDGDDYIAGIPLSILNYHTDPSHQMGRLYSLQSRYTRAPT